MNNKCKVEKINGRYYIDGEASHNPKIEELKKWYKEYNAKYFYNKLPECKFFLKRKSTYPAQCYPSSKEIHFNNGGKYIWNRTIVKKILLHEMVHMYIHCTYGIIGKCLNSFHHMWPFAFEMFRLNKKHHLGLKLLDDVPLRSKYKN